MLLFIVASSYLDSPATTMFDTDILNLTVFNDVILRQHEFKHPIGTILNTISYFIISLGPMSSII